MDEEDGDGDEEMDEDGEGEDEMDEDEGDGDGDEDGEGDEDGMSNVCDWPPCNLFSKSYNLFICLDFESIKSQIEKKKRDQIEEAEAADPSTKVFSLSTFVCLFVGGRWTRCLRCRRHRLGL